MLIILLVLGTLALLRLSSQFLKVFGGLPWLAWSRICVALLVSKIKRLQCALLVCCKVLKFLKHRGRVLAWTLLFYCPLHPGVIQLFWCLLIASVRWLNLCRLLIAVYVWYHRIWQQAQSFADWRGPSFDWVILDFQWRSWPRRSLTSVHKLSSHLLIQKRHPYPERWVS